MDSRVRVLRQKQVGPFRIVEKAYGGNLVLSLHQHPTAFLSFLLAGAYVEVSNWGERLCPPGTVIWHPQAEAHSDRFHPRGGLLIDLEIEDSWLQDAAQELRPATEARTFSGGLPYALGLGLYRQLSSENGLVEETVTQLLSFFFCGLSNRRPPPWFCRAVEMINDGDEGPSLGSVARQVGVHPVHLARSFRRFLGCTFSDYVAKVRVRRAFELLLNPASSIVDVAYDCGFADHAHLCRSFKSCTGLTPSAFRDLAVPHRQS